MVPYLLLGTPPQVLHLIVTGRFSCILMDYSWGPWTQFYYNNHWQPGGDPNERTYQPKLSPKWISDDGKEMVLIWSELLQMESDENSLRFRSVKYYFYRMNYLLLSSRKQMFTNIYQLFF